jgi:hypothetical protein
VGFNDGHKVLLPFYPNLPVERDGSFVIGGLDQGRYYLAALERTSVKVQLLNGVRHEGLATTYYPGSQDFESAAPIDIKPGQEVRSIRLVLKKTGLFSFGQNSKSNGRDNHSRPEGMVIG